MTRRARRRRRPEKDAKPRCDDRLGQLNAFDVQKRTLLGRPGRPKSVECASIEVRQIVATLTTRNVAACSTFANRHQRCQRSRLAWLGSNENRAAVGRASSKPVSGLTIRGTYRPMPKPLSRIQLLWQRFCPPPAPANAIAPEEEREAQFAGKATHTRQARRQRPP